MTFSPKAQLSSTPTCSYESAARLTSERYVGNKSKLVGQSRGLEALWTLKVYVMCVCVYCSSDLCFSLFFWPVVWLTSWNLASSRKSTDFLLPSPAWWVFWSPCHVLRVFVWLCDASSVFFAMERQTKDCKCLPVDTCFAIRRFLKKASVFVA